MQLSLVIVASMVVVAACLISINHIQTRKYLLGFAEREMALATEAVSQGLASYLGPVGTAARVLANAELGNPMSAGFRERFFRMSEQVLDGSPQSFSVYAGFPDGSHIRTGRSNESLRKLLKIPADLNPSVVRGVIPGKAAAKAHDSSEWFYREEDTDPWAKTVVPGYEFDPRTRPWYLRAEASDELQWTSVYVWTTGSVGITAAHAVRDAESQFRGVIGIDVRLGDLARFLRSVTISENSRIFIARPNGRLVAHSEFIEGSKAEPQAETGAVALDVMDETFRAEHVLDYRLFSTAEPNGEILILEHEGVDVMGLATPIDGVAGLNAVLYVAVPVWDFVGFAVRANLLSLAGSIALFGLMLIVGLRIARGISRPIERLAELARTVRRQSAWAVEQHPGSIIREVDEAGESFNEMLVGLRERETIRDLFGRYVPEEIASQLIQQGGSLEPVSAECTVLYTDIEAFSSLAESLPAGKVVEMLNAYFTTATEIIERSKGVITQFQGDAILAIYNIPVADAVHACNAVESALELHNAVSTRQFAGQELKVRVGISTGHVVAGNVGAEGRLGYTVHGDAVNLAARLEEMNKQFNTRILVSEATKSACPKHVFNPIGEVPVRGKRKGVTVYSVPVGEGRESAAHRAVLECLPFTSAPLRPGPPL